VAERYDTLVIGAGPSGLAAGLRLAQFEQRVAVLERHYLWGGLNSFYKKGGRRFDVGLHALTNFVPRGARGRPLTRVLRQLRLSWDDLRLGEQHGSRVVFDDLTLRFSNDFELLRSEVHAAFPSQRAGFERLLADLAAAPYEPVGPARMTRDVLAEYLDDQLLVDALMHPLLWYGSPTPYDLDWASFVVLWRAIYEEGFARPAGGVRPLLELLRRRFLTAGGELMLRAGVRALLRTRDGAVAGVELDDGRELHAARVLSSAGWVETLRMCGPGVAAEHAGPAREGRLSFVECCTRLDRFPADLGHDATVVFYNLAPRTLYEVPEGPVDVRSGVVCCPDNYAGQEPETEGTFRVTVLANAAAWARLPRDEYYAQKDAVWARAHEAVSAFAPDVRPHTVFKDVFTPRTIEHYTGHVNGAVYGSPHKAKSGETPVPGLFVCGTDQGYLGIIGALLSGIAMANRHALVPA
jgi:phytoene dehydrogenase-like protein